MNGIIHVLELAAGQLWRLVLDSWGIAGIGLVAALLVIVRRDVRSDLRIMAALSVVVTTVIACTAPAALPPDQPQAWASGRYLDGMIIVFFLVGAAMLLRARMRDILVCAAISTGLFVLAAVTVAVYIGTTVPTVGFGAGFNFAEPAVLTQNWTQASVPLATAVTLVMLAVWIGFAFVLRRLRPGVALAAVSAAFGVCVAAVSLIAVAQMTSHVSRATDSPAQAAMALMDAWQAAARRPGRRHVLAGLVPVGAAGVRGVKDRTRPLHAEPPGAAARDDRGRGGVADREVGPGRMAPGPGGLADRRLRPGRGLGRLAQGLSPAAAASTGGGPGRPGRTRKPSTRGSRRPGRCRWR